jgi:hypothetical protein
MFKQAPDVHSGQGMSAWQASMALMRCSWCGCLMVWLHGRGWTSVLFWWRSRWALTLVFGTMDAPGDAVLGGQYHRVYAFTIQSVHLSEGMPA